MSGLTKDFYVSKSHQDNVAIAEQILEDVVGLNRNQATILGLSGDLGSGKTTWTKGLVEFLGGEADQVQSPTFVLMRDYQLGQNLYKFKRVHHLDVYRLKKAAEFSALKLDPELQNPENLFVIEWWKKIKSKLPKPVYQLSFEEINDFTRTISVQKIK
jgi:tRNA threonylcarbamoyladenosine biosynthesis protein TsaE